MLKSEHQNNPDCANLEQMSTSSLEKLLLQDFHAQERGEDGMSELYQAARVLAEREPDSGGAADRAWEHFQENYLPFLNDGGALSEDSATLSSDAAPGRRDSYGCDQGRAGPRQKRRKKTCILWRKSVGPVWPWR